MLSLLTGGGDQLAITALSYTDADGLRLRVPEEVAHEVLAQEPLPGRFRCNLELPDWQSPLSPQDLVTLVEQNPGSNPAIKWGFGPHLKTPLYTPEYGYLVTLPLPWWPAGDWQTPRMDAGRLEFFAATASFCSVLRALYCYGGTHTFDFDQLLAVSVSSLGWGDGSNAMEVAVSNAAVARLTANSLTAQIEAYCTSAMHHAYRRMFNRPDPTGLHNIYCRLDGSTGQVMFNCSGNAAGLDPSHDDPLNHLLGHNIDGPVQVLTLLAGVAALDECLRDPFKDYVADSF